MSEKPFGLAVRAVILDGQGRCLLVRRSDACTNCKGQWEWPGGKVDDGETFDAALRREVREETGLEIRLLGVVGAFGFEMEKVNVVTLCMEAELLGGVFRLDEDHDKHAWVPLAEMLQWELTSSLKGLAAAYAAGRTKGAKQHG